MNLNNYTIKAQETIQAAQQVAFNNGNPNIETNHLLKALLADKDSPVEFLLKRNNINIAFTESKVDESITKLPKIQSGEPAQNVSRDLNTVFLKANNVLKEFLYNSPEYEKLIKIQDNMFNSGMEAAIAKKNLINRIMELYKNVYNNDIPVQMILPLRDCFIYLQLNIYLFMTMLENSNYSFFEDSVLSSYILTKKVLLELFNKYFNVLELKIHAEEKINKLSTINDINDDKYLTSKIEIANIIKDLIVINNDYLIIKIKNNYPSVFNEILKNTIGIDI